MLGAINKILDYSAVDGSGNRMVIFFQGCNFNCSYCHNPETIHHCTHCGICMDSCQSDALSWLDNKVLWAENNCIQCDKCLQICPESSSPKVKYFSVDELIQRIEKVRNFISGITISGGECTQQFDFLKELLIACKQKNISAYIDTNAYLESEKMKELSRYFDKAMPDIKVFDTNQHIALTGKPSDLVFENVEFLLQENKIHEIRTVIYPGLNAEETVEKVSLLISKYNKQLIYKLIKFRPHGSRNSESIESPSDESMLYLKSMATTFGCSLIIIS